MAAQYGLWRDDAPAGIVGYASEGEALDAVRGAVEHHGPAAVSGWALVRIPARGNWRTVAEGNALLERAQRGLTAPATPPNQIKRRNSRAVSTAGAIAAARG